MGSGRKMWIPLAISVIAYCFVGSSGTECAVNRCPHLEKCLQRHVPGQPDYVCECTEPFFNGYDCTETSNNRILSTCYGADCATGSYTSPNYETTGYENRERILVLLYIPWATEIRFSFDPGFQIERNTDELFVGQGLTIPHNDLGNGNNLNPALYLFDGFGAPAPFSVYNDTAFIFFVSDRSSTYAGFRIFWNATVADPPPMTPASSTEGSTANTVVLHTVSKGFPTKAPSTEMPQMTGGRDNTGSTGNAVVLNTDPPPTTKAPSTEVPQLTKDTDNTGSTGNAVVLHTGLLTMVLVNIAVAIGAQK